MRYALAWAPAILFGAGAILTVTEDQRALPLRAPLAEAVPDQIMGRVGHDVTLSDAEIRTAAVTAYLYRDFVPADSAAEDPSFSVYVGYYDSQTQGRTIHSPKNCLPGSGWEALASSTIEIETPSGPVLVNRYLLQNREAQALVLYWYQGRGRVASNEYIVKWDLLRDAALRHRSDEALVRVVVPVRGDDGVAEHLGRSIAAVVIPTLSSALPE